MNYRYSILATALAVGLFAIPATAGVTDVTGGSGVTVKTTVNKHYDDAYEYKTNEKYRGDKTQWVGKLHYYEHSAITDANGLHDVDYDYVVSNPSDTKGEVLSSLFNHAYNKQDQRAPQTLGWDKWHDQDDHEGNTWTVLQDTVVSSVSTDEYTDYKENKSLMRTEKTRSELTYNGTTFSKGSIFVGDPDDIFNAYSASGSATINEVRDDYYLRTHVMERDHNYGSVTVYQVNADRRYSPIVLDLDGDGKIEASNGQYLAHNNFSDKVVAFDFFGNGFPVLTEWVGANDGLLCRPNADGSVKGTNLFGIANGFNNGYEEMASLDVDNSGALEGAELKDLRVWTDVNGNGIAEANELKTLDELGITSIKVSHNNYASTFVRNGKTYKSFDWWPNCREMRKVDMASVIK